MLDNDPADHQSEVENGHKRKNVGEHNKSSNYNIEDYANKGKKNKYTQRTKQASNQAK